MIYNVITFGLSPKYRIYSRMGVNFINILRAHFLHKSASHSFSLYILALAKVQKHFCTKKCARKMLMKLTTGLNFLDRFWAIFFQLDLYADQFLALCSKQVNTKNMLLKDHFDLYAKVYTVIIVSGFYYLFLKPSCHTQCMVYCKTIILFVKIFWQYLTMSLCWPTKIKSFKKCCNEMWKVCGLNVSRI